MLSTVLIVLVALVVLLVGSGVRMVQQYQRGVVLRFGRLLPEVRQPGLQLMIPVADRMVKVPVQTIVLDVPPQGAITKDNVTLSVDAVVYFRVTDPVKAVVNVENYLGAISQVARTSLRSVIGRADLDTMLSDREQVNAELRAVIDTPTDDWGISVDRVEIKDIALPESMRRAMAHQAEAERDRRARVIAADGEYQASTRLADAARVMADTPGALQLRLLQTVSDVASDQNSTLVMPLPVELLRFFENATGTSVPARAGSAAADASISPPPTADSAAPGRELPQTDGDLAGKGAVTTGQEAGPR
ncbi:slipin family protein [Pseudonocardia cypriaca]|uniref:Regulator of protease activity HflC (Stomatin/prohibitin superfamily) n=1 Tax=Pseudonocardia cypriaca TaxID=882449 RepID=A0A543FRG3_9PSEU|nr:slipin family protein [Pseudonocardia cypriaca]TQM36435.1 regulator of protease activity HflC (stomatin/prohibitin superfamily) [Pseudonocardia cypriaca]